MKPVHRWKTLFTVLLLAVTQALAASQWEGPAADLAQKIESVLGTSQAKLVLRNQSSIPDQEVSAIRRLFEADLKSRGVVLAGDESANAVHITLSENLLQRVWVAEIQQGNESKIVMAFAGSVVTDVRRTQASIVLQATPLIFAAGGSGSVDTGPGSSEILSVMADDTGLVMLRSDAVTFFAAGPSGFSSTQTLPVVHRRPFPRDLRGRLVRHARDAGFTAYLPATECEGNLPTPVQGETTAALHCKESDDPWPLGADLSISRGTTEATTKAFYNSARDFFTGVVTPAFNFELPPFYDAVELPRVTGTGLLVHETSGAVELIDGIARRPVSGARDWGSDFAVLRTKCGVDPIVLVSASGEAVSDSLRAYAIPTQEAIAVSAPLAVEGTVRAMFPLNDNSAAVVVRKEDKTGSHYDEVLRVTTLCN